MVAATAAATAVAGDSVTLSASKDNTLYDTADARSNGAGSHFFAGVTAQASTRRAVIAFDVAGALPPCAEVSAVTLTLYMSKSISGTQSVSLHRLTTDWGEGASNAPGQEGGGAPAEPGDATWEFAFFPTIGWADGGEFVAAPSATTSVTGIAFYSWSSDGMVADVQAWLDDPTQQFGWALLGNEATAVTAKRFNSRENMDLDLRPVLEVVFQAPLSGDANGDGAVNVDDLLVVLAQWGPCPGCQGDVDCDGDVDVNDLLLVLGNWS
jgi:hypothetical protein